MMKGWVVFIGMILLCLCSSLFSGYGDANKVNFHRFRKLKASHLYGSNNSVNTNVDNLEGKTSNIDLLDYHQTDPVPSSKASIRHGPIQHDVPLLPYIPEPPSPDSN
ncbi:hypothetical protein R6Q59_010578 [Mikania micrantha]